MFVDLRNIFAVDMVGSVGRLISACGTRVL